MNDEGGKDVAEDFNCKARKKKWRDILLLTKIFYMDFSPSQIFKQNEEAWHGT